MQAYVATDPFPSSGWRLPKVDLINTPLRPGAAQNITDSLPKLKPAEGARAGPIKLLPGDLVLTR